MECSRLSLFGENMSREVERTADEYTPGTHGLVKDGVHRRRHAVRRLRVHVQVRSRSRAVFGQQGIFLARNGHAADTAHLAFQRFQEVQRRTLVERPIDQPQVRAAPLAAVLCENPAAARLCPPSSHSSHPSPN